MRRSEQIENEGREWEEMKRRGHLRYVLLGALVWTGGYTIANDLFLAVEKLGLFHGPGMSPLDVFVLGVSTGGIWSALRWSDMKRKFRIPPPEEDWIAK